MDEMFKYLQKLPPSMSVLILVLAIIIMIISKWSSITKSLKWISKGSRKTKRTCGDCIIILFGIREKYEYEDRRLDTNLLRMQMKFAEHKIQKVIFFLSQSFSEDIKIYGEGADYDRKVTQSALYCEALKNGMLSVRDELRRSFKENGFAEFSENEFSYYVKEKSKTLITMVRSYLSQYYVDCDKTIVNLKERFERMDESSSQKFEGWTFEVFTNAKDLAEDWIKRKKDLRKTFKEEIDSFVKFGETTSNS